MPVFYGVRVCHNQRMSALTGIRVLDLSRILAGPYCTQLLADYGAEVIKIEHPDGGDGTRQWGPPYLGDQSAYFLSVNRNKRSVTLNLKSEVARDAVRRLAAESDVLVENFMPGMLDGLGIGYAALSALNPKLVYCAITGYGQTGPYRDRPGYDFAIQAEGGLMSITGPVDGEPHKVGVAIADIMTGLFAANAIQAALLARARTGAGQYIDVALLDTQIAMLANIGQNVLASGQAAARFGNAHASIVPYQSFATHDGHIAIAVGNDSQFAALCSTLAQPHLAADPRFVTNPLRVTHRDACVAALAEPFAQHSTAHWLAQLRTAGVPCAPINDVRTALADPQVRARDMIQSAEHATLGPIDLLGPVAKLSATPANIRSAPPLLGADTDAVLTALGYSAEAIAQMQAGPR
jgi:crotonobetainyl-CoA:carnitine CoA-transferase CaiB-like acyl-CoA transferase